MGNYFRPSFFFVLKGWLLCFGVRSPTEMVSNILWGKSHTGTKNDAFVLNRVKNGP